MLAMPELDCCHLTTDEWPLERMFDQATNRWSGMLFALERVAGMKYLASPKRHALRLVEPEESRVDDMLDLSSVPSEERWSRISAAIQRLDERHGRQWKLKLLFPDGPETAAEMPLLIAQFGRAGLRYDSAREPGGVQGTVLAPREDPEHVIAA